MPASTLRSSSIRGLLLAGGLSQIVGKEHYDAWVRLDAIDSVEMRRGGV